MVSRNEQGLVKFESEFEGQRLTKVHMEGRPYWVAREVGAALGYAGEGRNLVDLVTREWCTEFVEGKHFAVLRGKSLKDFKQLAGLSGSNTPSIMLLTREGVNLAGIKGDKEKSARLRAFIAEDVLTQIEEHGNYLPQRAETAPRQFGHSAIDIYRFSQMAAKSLMRLGVKADIAESAALATVRDNTGIDIESLRNAITGRQQEESLLIPSDIGELVGCTAQQVNQMLAAQGLQQKIGKRWQLTEEGGKHGELKPFTAPNGHQDLQIQWHPSAVELLRKTRGAA